MKFNFKQALTYFSNDDKLAKKIAIIYPFSVFAIISSISAIFLGNLDKLGNEAITKHFELYIAFVVALLFGTLLSFIYYGYFAINANLRIFKPESKLPELNKWKSFFINGLKTFGGFFVWQIITHIIAFVVAFFVIIAGVILFLTIKAFIHTPGIFAGNGTAIFAIIFVCFAIIFGLFLGMVQTSTYTSFLTNLDFESFFDFKKINKILFKNFKPFLKYFCLTILFKILYCILFAVFFVTIIGILFIPVLQIYYSAFISDIEAQFIRHVFNLNKPEIEESL